MSKNIKKIAWSLLLLAILMHSAPTVNSILSSSIVLASSGSINPPGPAGSTLTVDPSETIGRSKLQLAVQIDHANYKALIEDPEVGQLMSQINIKLVRVFDFKSSNMKPCTRWYPETKTGEWDWREMDAFVDAVAQAGATPLFTLGGFTDSGMYGYPPGMPTDANGLVVKEDWAAYCSEWVKHFKNTGRTVVYYEIGNEAHKYYTEGGWRNHDYERLDAFMQLFGATRNAMKAVNPSVMVSFDFICHKKTLEYWLDANGPELDTLNFHKYDDYRYPNSDDATMFQYAEEKHFGPWPLGGYSVMDAQRRYYEVRGKTLPVMCTESNMNAKFSPGDPRIQTMTGAVWTALTLRQAALEGVRFFTYYQFYTSMFGMVSGNKEKYPAYHIYWMYGENNHYDSSLIESTVDSQDLRSLAWKDLIGRVTTILIHKGTSNLTVRMDLPNGSYTLYKLDESNEGLQQVSISSGEVVELNGYTVILLRGT